MPPPPPPISVPPRPPTSRPIRKATADHNSSRPNYRTPFAESAPPSTAMSNVPSVKSVADSGNTYSSSRIADGVMETWSQYGYMWNDPGIQDNFRNFTKNQEAKQQKRQKEQDHDNGQSSSQDAMLPSSPAQPTDDDDDENITPPSSLCPPPPMSRPWPGDTKLLSYNQLVDNLYYWQCMAAGYGHMRRKASEKEEFNEELREWQKYAEEMAFHLARMRLSRIKETLGKGKGKEKEMEG